ncbi:MAG: hypothetical protein GTN78_00095 [Gemmatimonadales bacterium]|nr:hypothetical protein [Gemmatimonadales bacterium]
MSSDRSGDVFLAIGGSGGEIPSRAGIGLIAPSQNVQQIEDAHLAALHWVYLELKKKPP